MDRAAVKPFATRREAEIWARRFESKYDCGIYEDYRSSERITMRQLFKRYEAETKDTKANAPCDRYMLRLLDKEFGPLPLSKLTRELVASFRDRRLEQVSTSTVRNNLHLLSAVIKRAMNDWGYELPYNPVHRITKPKPGLGRDRRLESDEEERLLQTARTHSNPTMEPLIILAIETAMRLGELLSLKWANVSYEKREAFLPRTKNGYARRVPLSLKAVQTLQSIHREPDQKDVFTSWSGSGCFQHAWQRLTKKAGIKNLRFHDLRHEATSRFAEMGLDIMRISAITGHRSLQMLKRYTHFRIIDLARELDRNTI